MAAHPSGLAFAIDGGSRNRRVLCGSRFIATLRSTGASIHIGRDFAVRHTVTRLAGVPVQGVNSVLQDRPQKLAAARKAVG
jgi:hypothetical protein